MKKILLLPVFSLALTASATIHPVGPTQFYVSPNALYVAGVVQTGDTIDIDAATYTGTACLAAWQPDNLYIRGVGGRPHLVAAGAYILGKGIWVFVGDNISVNNIEFSGAAVPDHNGAGIRLDGTGMTARYCYFHDNENGILTSNPYAGDIVIEYCEFAYNGYGDGFTHNLYIGHVHSLLFTYNYSHHTDVGHNLKSRADENYIAYNRIMDEETGNSSRLIDLPNGGLALVVGNLLMQGVDAENNNLLGYGLEGLSNTPPHELYANNNTFVNKRVQSCLFVSVTSGTTAAEVTNNIFGGTGTLTNGPVTLTTNLVETDIPTLAFFDEPNYDYRLTVNSPAINIGSALGLVNGIPLTPNRAYLHPTGSEARVMENTIDVGAYEYNSPVGISGFENKDILVFPNPTSGKLWIDIKDGIPEELRIHDSFGRLVHTQTASLQMDVSELDSGVYRLSVERAGGAVSIQQIIKY